MTAIAAIGTVIAAAALFVVLSGFAGLKDFSLQFASLADPDLKIVPQKGKSFIVLPEDVAYLKAQPEIANFSNLIEERAVLQCDDKHLLVNIKGVDDNYLNVIAVDTMLIVGNWFDANSPQIVSGIGIASNLGFGVMDISKRISFMVPKPGKGQITSLNKAFKKISVVNTAVFDINEQVNTNHVFAPIELGQELLGYEKNQATAIAIKAHNDTDMDDLKTRLQEHFNTRFIVKNRAQLNDSLYKMLKTEHLAVYFIFTLVIIIALFNIIGVLIMMIIDKKNSLHTLYNLGMPLKKIKQIFFLQGSLMVFISGVTGLLLGVLLVGFQLKTQWVMITPNLPYPVKLQFINVLMVLTTITVLGLGAAKLASMRIKADFLSS